MKNRDVCTYWWRSRPSSLVHLSIWAQWVIDRWVDLLPSAPPFPELKQLAAVEPWRHPKLTWVRKMALGHCTKILIVEDDALIGAMLEAMVEDMGYWVVGPFRNLKDALDHAKEDDIDFGLLDFNLGPEATVLPVIEVLKERGLPFAIASGSDPSMIRQFVPDVPILSKPVVESELEKLLP